MELIRKQADRFILNALGKMEHTDSYHVIVDALKSELTNYYKQPDKLVFIEQVEQKIIGLLKKENQQDLNHDIRLAPVWIQKVMKKAL